jgi:hypothetical protein
VTLLLQGIILLEKGSFSQTIDNFNQAIKINPNMTAFRGALANKKLLGYYQKTYCGLPENI